MRHIGEKMILLLCIAVFGIAAVKLIDIGKEYYDGQKEYEELKAYIKEVPVCQPEKMTGDEPEKETGKEIDFEGLRKINEDLVAWIQIPGIGVEMCIRDSTSSNDAVKKFIQMSGNFKTKREIETLLAGEEIIKEIHQELVYPEMYQSVENVWSLLFMTGYLTQRGRVDAKRYKLAIPNLEIRDIFETQIMEYFKESVAKDGDTLSRFCDALKNGEETKVGEIFESYLKKTISIRDTFVKKASKENFYHGILLGILGVKEEWYVSSNQESGEGYSDILVETENSETVILIEVKYANDGNLDQACERALQQIEEKKYDEELRENGVDKILKYGIAC